MVNPVQQKLDDLTVENAKLKNQLVCKRCHFDNSKEFNPLNDELIKSYFKLVLSQQAFKKEYNLFDNQMIVTLVEPTRKLLMLYINLWDILGNKAVQYAPDFLCLLLLEKIQVKGDNGLETMYNMTTEERYEMFKGITFDNVENVIPPYYQNLPQVLLVALKQTAAQFNDLCLALADRVHDENFWKGVGQN